MTGFEFLADHTTQILMVAAVAGMVLDFVSGFLNALMHHEVSSEKMRIGLWHKVSFMGAIILGIYLQWVESVGHISAYLGVDVPAVSVICVVICAIEAVSIFENLKKMNPDIPDLHLSKEEEEEEE